MPPLRNVTLELSLKPFADPSEPAVRAVVSRLLDQWAPLYRDAAQLSFLLWIGDGSEILDYRKRLDETFEWGCWIGTANPYRQWPGDPESRCPHSQGTRYIPNPPVFTFGWLKQLTATLKELGAARIGKPIRVGATFDPGPEFARSSFKYERHREILGTMWHGTFTYCYAVLDGDTREYAGYPNGIPAGTTIGAFLGRQVRHFAADLGFDYLWLSNGFGFGTETWVGRGATFDAQRFMPEKAAEIRPRLLSFWQEFRRECPDLPLEVRGTNQSTGVDLASDALPLAEIYRGKFNLVAPPNSPWAAINGDFGLELAGWMSHIAELPDPGRGFPFRFYTHDPWWLNSPWLDRYERQPHDIYLPLAVSRIDARGEIETPDSILFLTVDDSLGRMPDAVPDEVIPHIKAARRTGPDAAGPLVWVYPFDEYHEWTFGAAPRPDEVFFGDRFMRSAINHGFPLNTVMSTTSFSAASRVRPETWRNAVLVSPVPDAGTRWSNLLFEHVQQGGSVLLYGPTAHADDAWRNALNLEPASPLEGRFELEARGLNTAFEREWRDVPREFHHDPLMSGGGLAESPGPKGDADLLSVLARQGEHTRALAVARRCPGGRGGVFAWVRGSEVSDPSLHDAEHRPEPVKSGFPVASLMRAALGAVGYTAAFAPPESGLLSPVLTVSRHRNSFFFSGYMPNTRVELALEFPRGAPLFNNADAVIANGCAQYRLPRAWRHECRVFIRQTSGAVSAHEVLAGVPGVNGRLHVRGLQAAEVAFYPDPAHVDSVQMLRDPVYPYFQGEFLRPRREADGQGVALVAENVTGELLISW